MPTPASDGSATGPTGPTRRSLTDHQAQTVTTLIAATREVLGEEGFEGMTIRSVARRAGVAPATAYTYFSSKNHIVAELFWRLLVPAVPEPDPARTMPDRVADVLTAVAGVVSGNEQLARATVVALSGADPDVDHIRRRVGGFVRQRLTAATGLAGTPVDPRIELLEMLCSGALVQVGTGYGTYDVADRLATSARRLMAQPPGVR